MRLLSFVGVCVSMFTLQTNAMNQALFQDFDHFTKESFEDVILNDDENMWMVAFYADWCPYCKPVYEELSEAKNDYSLLDKKVKFGVVDVMANRDILNEYDVKQSPSIMVFGVDKGRRGLQDESMYGLWCEGPLHADLFGPRRGTALFLL